MLRPLLAFGAFDAALAGCLANRPLPAPPPVEVVPIRLFGKELPSTEEAIRGELLRFVSPGTPMEQAETILKTHGLEQQARPFFGVTRHFWSPAAHARPGSEASKLYCYAYPAVVGAWGQRFAAVEVVLTPDAANAVKDIQIMVRGPWLDQVSDFFEARPALKEPVGLPLAEAQAQMQAAGFQCMAAPAGGTRGDAFLYCQAQEERAKGRVAFGVRLFYDRAGVVRDTEVIHSPLSVIRLFGKELAADESVLRDELRRVITPGMSMDQAKAVLKAHGLERGAARVRRARVFVNVSEKYRPSLPSSATSCYSAERPVLSNWGRTFVGVAVFVVSDAANRVKEVDVLYSPEMPSHFHDYFVKRPDLCEPVGVPVAEAQTRMRAAGFKCAVAGPDGGDTRGQSHLYCQAFDENALGGRVVRVRLFYDKAGVVRDSYILQEDGWFDPERCMLPDADDAAARYALRAALFPLRVGCRYTLITAGLMLRGMAYGCGHAHCGR